MSYFSNHKKFLEANEWLSLPEITDSNGKYNDYSSRSQAWSVACVLEACYDILKS